MQRQAAIKSSGERLLKAENLCKIYHRHQPDEVMAIADVSLEIACGEVIALTGPSGSGKTSLLSVLGCMARPTSGRVQLNGRTVSQLPENFLSGLRRTHYGYIFQQLNLLRDLSVLDNVLLPLIPTEMPLALMKRRGEEILGQLALGNKSKQRVSLLSGGEQQRVAIARALVADPQVLIADEPTAHLDSQLTTELLEIFSQLNQSGKTIIIATHDPQVYENALITRTLALSDGRLVGHDPL